MSLHISSKGNIALGGVSSCSSCCCYLGLVVLIGVLTFGISCASITVFVSVDGGGGMVCSWSFLVDRTRVVLFRSSSSLSLGRTTITVTSRRSSRAVLTFTSHTFTTAGSSTRTRT